MFTYINLKYNIFDHFLFQSLDSEKDDKKEEVKEEAGETFEAEGK